MALEITLTGAPVLGPDGWDDAPIAIADGLIADLPTGRHIDLSGYEIRPGIVDIHGDGFERHVAPRRGALRDIDSGIVALSAELAANGITTAVLAQFWSWEGGMRSPDFAETVFDAVTRTGPTVPVDLRLQMRLETHLLDEFQRAEDALDRYGIGYLVFSDHLPHDRLAAGRRPPRLTGQALKSGRNPEAHLAMMQALHARGAEVPGALDALAGRLLARDVILGSHDDHRPSERVAWHRRGVRIAEFPETLEAAQTARAQGDAVVLGAPNVMRGASHKGNASALDLIAEGVCDALASDYHYPAPHLAARRCVETGVLSDAAAWALVSDGPARVLNLTDRGRIAPGLRADLVILDRATGRLAATIAAGTIACMTGPIAERLLA